MDKLDRGSVSMWIDRLKDGEAEAARLIWNRYFEKLVEVARRRLGRLRGVPTTKKMWPSVSSSAFAKGPRRDDFRKCAIARIFGN